MISPVIEIEDEEQDEHEYCSDCDCEECRDTADEYRAMNREYERAVRGW